MITLTIKRQFLGYKFRLFFANFMQGLISEFSTYGEIEWLQRFTLTDNNWINAFLNLAWFPPLQYILGKLCDCLRKYMNFGFQIAFSLVIPTILWGVITWSVSVPNLLPDYTVLVLMALAESGPSINHVILDGARASYYNSLGENVTPQCERMRIIGALTGKLVGALVIHQTNLTVTFGIHTALFFITILCCIEFGREHRKQGYIYVCNSVDLGMDDEPVVQKQTWWGWVKSFLCEPWYNEAPTMRRFKYYIALLAMLPTGENCLIYYKMNGPLGITMFEMGLMGAASSLSEIMATYLSIKHVELVKMGWVIGTLNSLNQWLVFLIVARLTVEWVSNFTFLFMLSCLAGLIRGIIDVTFNSMLAETSSSGNETTEMTARKGMIKWGILVQIALDTAMTSNFQVNHDNYTLFPYYIWTTCIFALMTIWPSVLIGRDYHHKQQNAKPVVEEEELEMINGNNETE